MMRSRINKVMCMFMSLVALVSISVTAGATDIMPIYERVVYATCSLNSESSRQLEGSVLVSTARMDELRGTVELKRNVNGTWVTVATWNDIATVDFRCTFTKYVLSGYTYKLFGTVDVYSSSGQYCETVYLESDPIYI